MYKLCLIGVNEKIVKESVTVCSHGDADAWFVENVPSELEKYVLDKECQHNNNDFIFYGAPFAICFKLIPDQK